MKNLVGLLILCSSSCLATPALVQSTATFCSACGSRTATPATNVTAGNLFVFVGLGGQGESLHIGDSVGDVFVSTITTSVAGHGQILMAYTCSAVGGATTVTLRDTTSSTQDLHLHLFEVSGILTTACGDASGTNSGTAATSTVSTSGSVAQTTEYVLAPISDWDHNVTFTQGSGYTIQKQTNNGTTGDVLASEDGNSKTGLSGTQTATMTGAGGTDTWLALIQTFKGTAAGGVTVSPSMGLMGVGGQL